MAGRASWILGLGGALLLGWQSWRIGQLDGGLEVAGEQLDLALDAAEHAESEASRSASEVRGLRARVEILEAQALFAEDAALARSVAERRVETRGSGASLLIVGAKGPGVQPPAPTKEAVIEDAVTAVLEQAREDQLSEQGSAYVSRAAAKLETTVDALVAEGALDAGQRQAVVDLLVGEAHEVWELKAEVQRGDLAQDEAVGEYEEIRKAYGAALTELLGEPGAEAVLASTGGK